MTSLRSHALNFAFAGGLGAGAALWLCATAQAAMMAPPALHASATATHTSVTRIQYYAGKCPPGFHGINAPNGNGYRCVPNER